MGRTVWVSEVLLLLLSLAAAACTASSATGLNILVIGARGAGKSRFVNAALRASGMTAGPAVVGTKASARPVTTMVGRFCVHSGSGTAAAHVCWYDTPALDVCPCLGQLGGCDALATLDALVAGASPARPWPPSVSGPAAAVHAADVVVLVSTASGPSAAACGRRLTLHLANRSALNPEATEEAEAPPLVPVAVVLAGPSAVAAGLGLETTPVFAVAVSEPHPDAAAVLAALEPVVRAKARRRRRAAEEAARQGPAAEEAKEAVLTAEELAEEEAALDARLKSWPDEKVVRITRGQDEDVRVRELAEKAIMAGVVAVTVALLLRFATFVVTTGVDKWSVVAKWCRIAGARVRRHAAMHARGKLEQAIVNGRHFCRWALRTAKLLVTGVITGSIFTWGSAVAFARWLGTAASIPARAVAEGWTRLDLLDNTLRLLNVVSDTAENVTALPQHIAARRRAVSMKGGPPPPPPPPAQEGDDAVAARRRARRSRTARVRGDDYATGDELSPQRRSGGDGSTDDATSDDTSSVGSVSTQEQQTALRAAVAAAEILAASPRPRAPPPPPPSAGFFASLVEGFRGAFAAAGKAEEGGGRGSGRGGGGGGGGRGRERSRSDAGMGLRRHSSPARPTLAAAARPVADIPSEHRTRLARGKEGSGAFMDAVGPPVYTTFDDICCAQDSLQTTLSQKLRSEAIEEAQRRTSIKEVTQRLPYTPSVASPPPPPSQRPQPSAVSESFFGDEDDYDDAATATPPPSTPQQRSSRYDHERPNLYYPSEPGSARGRSGSGSRLSHYSRHAQGSSGSAAGNALRRRAVNHETYAAYEGYRRGGSPLQHRAVLSPPSHTPQTTQSPRAAAAAAEDAGTKSSGGGWLAALGFGTSTKAAPPAQPAAPPATDTRSGPPRPPSPVESELSLMSASTATGAASGGAHRYYSDAGLSTQPPSQPPSCRSTVAAFSVGAPTSTIYSTVRDRPSLGTTAGLYSAAGATSAVFSRPASTTVGGPPAPRPSPFDSPLVAPCSEPPGADGAGMWGSLRGMVGLRGDAAVSEVSDVAPSQSSRMSASRRDDAAAADRDVDDVGNVSAAAMGLLKALAAPPSPGGAPLPTPSPAGRPQRLTRRISQEYDLYGAFQPPQAVPSEGGVIGADGSSRSMMADAQRAAEDFIGEELSERNTRRFTQGSMEALSSAPVGAVRQPYSEGEHRRVQRRAQTPVV